MEKLPLKTFLPFFLFELIFLNRQSVLYLQYFYWGSKYALSKPSSFSLSISF